MSYLWSDVWGHSVLALRRKLDTSTLASLDALLLLTIDILCGGCLPAEHASADLRCWECQRHSWLRQPGSRGKLAPSSGAGSDPLCFISQALSAMQRFNMLSPAGPFQVVSLAATPLLCLDNAYKDGHIVLTQFLRSLWSSTDAAAYGVAPLRTMLHPPSHSSALKGHGVPSHSRLARPWHSVFRFSSPQEICPAGIDGSLQISTFQPGRRCGSVQAAATSQPPA